MREFLSHFFAAAQFLTLLVNLVLALSLYRLWEREHRRRATNTQSDLTNMMILFQTMRDMLRQQKDLARQLNDSLDKKVTLIRTTVDGALHDLDALREHARVLSVELAKSAAGAPGNPSPEPRAGDESEPAPKRPGPPPARFLPDRGATPPTLQAVAKPGPQSYEGNLIDNWVGLDFGSATPDDAREEPAAPVPERPSDAEAARQAFRALLNLDDAGRAEPDSFSDHDVSGTPASGNGKGKVKTTPLQARVYEYSDAGMTVPQISRELGIGKGEVRLILGLRSDKER